ncbi:helix-turn-helix domain-containing protein [Kitasatospora sp. NPDC057692]|uniref:GbsR/MarR family transcriptional regulator n=1 Tax=Kitasatospora sp. NPDC057692 TaxID=3346215 RepID=UPI003681C9D2
MTPQERQRISAGLADRLPFAEIARRLDRPTSTISREVARNGGASAYRPQQAQQAAARRARRGAPPTRPAPGPAVDAVAEVIVEAAVRSGMPRMMARVHVDLLLSEDGRRTAAELARRLRVSPASVSVAVNSLVESGYIRRERDPQRRRDVYVHDDEAWYRSIVISSRQTLDTAHAATDLLEGWEPDSPVAQRLAKAGAFLERVIQDMLDSAERWRGLLS